MNKRNTLFALAVICLMLLTNEIKAQCFSPGRYYNKIFTTRQTSNILYGNAIRFNGQPIDLRLNYYEPAEDTLTQNRPLLVLAFGGSFTAGFKTSPDIVKLCNEFSQRGYNCAAIDYRLGFENNNDSDTNQFKALIRGVQDMKAAVRFFYKDAQTLNLYKVDTNKIFIGGVSAGAFIALNYAYGKLDTLSFPAPPFALQALDEVGGTEGNSGNPGYSTKVSGVIDLCGAIADTVWIMPTDPPLCGVHGTKDDLVACQFDSAKAAQTVESRLFGGCDIKRRLSSFNTSSSMYIFEGAEHVPFILPCLLDTPCSYYMDTTIWVIRDFLYQQMCFKSLNVEDAADDVFEFNVYPNPSEEVISFATNYSKPVMLEVFAIDSRLLVRKPVSPQNIMTISKEETGKGLFLYRFTDAEGAVLLKNGKIIFQ